MPKDGLEFGESNLSAPRCNLTTCRMTMRTWCVVMIAVAGNMSTVIIDKTLPRVDADAIGIKSISR